MYWDIFVSLPSLVIAVAAVFAAYVALKLSLGWWSVVTCLAAVFLIGQIAGWSASRVLYRRPRLSVWLFEISALAPVAVAVLASAVLIWASVAIDKRNFTGVNDELAKAFLTALTAYVTAGFLKAAETLDESWIAPRVKAAFQAHFRGEQHYDAALPGMYYFVRGQNPIEPWVHSDPWGGVEGWTFAGRRRRAAAIAALLPTHPSWTPP